MQLRTEITSEHDAVCKADFHSIAGFLCNRKFQVRVEGNYIKICEQETGKHLIYIYIFWGSCPLREFCQVQNSLCVQSLALSYNGSITAQHSSSGR